jgi:ATP-binding cassette subfamily B protein
VGAFVVVAHWRWWVPLIAVATWMLSSRSVSRWTSAVLDDMIEITGMDRRRAAYLRSVLTGRAAAKEIRLFGLLDWLRDSYVATWQRTMAAVSRNRAHRLRGTMPPLALVMAVTAGMFALLTWDVWSGRIQAAVLVTTVQGILALSAFGPQGDNQSSMTRTSATLAQLANYRSELGLPFFPESTVVGPAGSGEGDAVVIRLTDVTFGYPGAAGPVLEHLNLVIPAGQSVAIVGLNGAGKSTLIKLLCGLYVPDSGTVHIDGLDPARDRQVRQRIAVIFQDFIRYHISARANVEAGAGWHPLDSGMLERLAAEAGLDHVLAGLERGWDTVLSAEYDGGTDLSGGQWQRFALARALAGVSRGAGLLVLDEPTSALDVRAEVALFERLLELDHPVTTILVSHRLSSVRHADRVVVLGCDVDGGARVMEDGTHTDLLAADGRYAHMFRLQAARFETVR